MNPILRSNKRLAYLFDSNLFHLKIIWLKNIFFMAITVFRKYIHSSSLDSTSCKHWLELPKCVQVSAHENSDIHLLPKVYCRLQI